MSTTQRDRGGRRARGKESSSTQKPGSNRDSTRQRSRQRRRTPSSRGRLLFWTIASLVVVIVIAAFVIHATLFGGTGSGGNGSIPGVVTYSNLSRNHVEGTVTYPQNPPVGGDHNPVWQNCGVYNAPVQSENAVHSMEHGAVWITYQPSLASSDVAQLRNLVSGHSYALLSPYPGLPTPVVISAWGVQLKVQSAGDPRLAQFLSKYEQGPQTPEVGSPCSGGIGTPIG